ncbi:MAG: PilW family protein [Herminiimonas sp.]|nr:PilW family protein [Herminiimonas sp.]
MTRGHNQARGFSLVELMIALVIGLVLLGAASSIYIAQSRMSKSAVSQASIQNVENAIAALITPAIRATGFNGCSTFSRSLSNLVAGGPPPVGTVGTTAAFMAGYDAIGTGGASTSYTISQNNAANGVSASGWSPALDSTLLGSVSNGSDVLVLLGAAVRSSPIGVTVIPTGGNSLTVQDATGLRVGQLAMVSDCLKSSIFKITAISANTITHAAGSGAMENGTDALGVNYPPASQFIPLEQTAFFVGQGQGDQSTLMKATYGSGAWTTVPLVPGVESMQVLYGIGNAGIVTRYVAASAVADWTLVYTVRLGFLIQGQIGSGATTTTASRQFVVLGTTVTVPADGRLRHLYEINVNLRNAS